MFVSMNDLEKHFDRFRKNIIGIDEYFSGPYGRKKLYIPIGLLVEGFIKKLKMFYKIKFSHLLQILTQARILQVQLRTLHLKKH